MGQFLIIQAADPGQLAGLVERAAALFASLCGLHPCERRIEGSTAVLLFPALRGGSPASSEDEAGTGWAAAAGICFYEGRNGAGALERFQKRVGAQTWTSSLEPVDGCFALILENRITGRWHVITDRLGSLHVYTARKDSCVLVSTSALVLAALTGAGWDPVACREFLGMGTVFENRSLFQGVDKLGPAGVYAFERGELRLECIYWDLKEIMYDRPARYGDVPQLADALRRAVETITGAFRRPVFDLTGGFDSRAILGALLRNGYSPETVVVGDPGSGDVTAAGRIADAFGLRHRHQELGEDWNRRRHERAIEAVALCDAECDALEYARILDHHLRLSKEFDASVNGSGGEICKGYWWELLYPYVGSKGHFDENRIAAGRFVYDAAGAGLLAVEEAADLTGHFAGVIRRANAGFENHPNTAKMDNIYLTLRMQRWQGRIASSTMRIWPCLSPFLMREVMEIALSAPPNVRLRHRMTRRLIERLDPRLAALPLADGSPAMPLRPSNALRFWPLALEMGEKVLARVRGKFSNGAAKGGNPSLGLLEEGGFGEMLEPARMRTAHLYKEQVLSCFLRRVRGDCFAESAQLGRVLTLELACRALEAQL